jgi:CRISPR/Cas system CSM-associated protein Csm2 small subunit
VSYKRAVEMIGEAEADNRALKDGLTIPEEIKLIRRFVVISLLCISCSGIAEERQINDLNTQPGTSNIIQENSDRQAIGQAAGKVQNTALYTGDGGKGITIVVPAPAIQNQSVSDRWIPQMFQDSITGDLVRCSAMTVIDRANEQLVLAEQSISASGNYSDDDYIRMGNLTNAQYIVVGRITNIAGNYLVSFRINHTETNEIRTAFNKSYSLREIETGVASKEVVRQLLTGMGIQLTEAGAELLRIPNETQIQALVQLSKGVAAERNGDLVEALAHFFGAIEANPNMREASVHIQNFSDAHTISTGNIRERAEWALGQKEKWEKIFADLKIYILKNLPVFIYDFSTIEDNFNLRDESVTIYVGPGIKVIPNRTVLAVYKTILDNWHGIRTMEENRVWAGNVHGPGGVPLSNSIYTIDFQFSYEIGLYDSYGDRIVDFRWYGSSPRLWYSHTGRQDFQVLAQHKYYDEINFVKILFPSIKLEKITDTITPRIDRIYLSYTNNRQPEFIDYPIFSINDWQEWLLQQ